MRCPRCQGELRPIARGDVQANECLACGGLWLKRGELESFLQKKAAALGIMRKAFGLVATPPAPAAMPCPECQTPLLETLQYRAVHVERCPTCEGLFLEPGELETIAERVIKAAKEWPQLDQELQRAIQQSKIEEARAKAEAAEDTSFIALLLGGAALISKD